MIQKVQLFSTKKDFLYFILACGFVLFYSILIEFNNYKNLIRFDSNIINATVLKQYKKTKLTKKNKLKTYQVLKLKSEENFTFYTTTKKTFPNSVGKKIKLEIWAENITFYEYMTSFYAFSKVIDIYKTQTLKQKLNSFIASKHKDNNVTHIYQALYTATPMPHDLQTTFSNLGVSHLLAISGFHLGVLATLLYFLFKMPYRYLQNRYFPYRGYKMDSFIFISIILLGYLLFLQSPPSLLRSYAMLIIGFILYDRGYKIISMLTLVLTIFLLLSFFPRLVFSLGFWLSVSGVFYIFLFLIHFKKLSKIWQFILLPFWVYLLMLPFSLVIFGNFSIYHPLSIIWTTLFSLFYPLSIVTHLIGHGDIFDNLLENFILLAKENTTILLTYKWLILHIILSLISVYKKDFIWILLLLNISIFIYGIYNLF